MALELRSDAIQDGRPIPTKYTGDGDDVSPPLQWSGAPDGAKSFVLIMDDPDAPNGTWVHWVLFNIPAQCTALPEGVYTERTVLGGAKQGENDFGNFGYGGPAPPPGHGPHRYFFKLYALDDELPLEPGVTKAEVVEAMTGKVLSQAQLMGSYERK
jgi:Raf kinase inhibitor-like YbhB/YbcL family protein